MTMEIQNLATFLDYHASVHARTRRLVVLIPAGELEWAPAAGKFTFGDLVRHLAAIERWMYGETVQGRPSAYAGCGRELADGVDAVLAYYDRLHDESRAIFAALTPERLAGKTVTPAGAPITTWKWLRAMIEHEAHHRGQLYLMLAIIGVPTPPLFGLTSEEVRTRAER